MHLYLASASPRRLTLLRQAGYRPRRVLQQAAERRHPGEAAEDMVRRIAREKVLSALESLDRTAAPGIILGADTAVVLGDEVLGKPASNQVARDVLRRLRGQRHRVLTGVALMRTDSRREALHVETTHVEFGCVDDAEIDRYVASGSPLDKAGAYGIQDLDDHWIARFEGLRSNVVGLPIERLAGWMESLSEEL
jgi:septum formation protein